MATSYKVDVTMTGETLDGLKGYHLYGFREVPGPAGAKPVLWFQTTSFELTSTIAWTEDYQVYTSLDDATQVEPAASYPVELGQVLRVTSPTGAGEVTSQGGVDGAISVLNLTSTSFTCGIAQAQPNGSLVPVSVLPLPGNSANQIVPDEKIILMFATVPLNTGVVVEQAYSPAILIDLTGVSNRSVSYDIQSGWSWQNQAGWATLYSATQDLLPLIKPTA